MDYQSLVERSKRTEVRQLVPEQIHFSLHNDADRRDLWISAHFDDEYVAVRDESLKILSKVFRVPENILTSLEPKTRLDVLKDRQRNLHALSTESEKLQHWMIDPKTRALYSYGPATKPILPFHRVDEVLEPYGFEKAATTEKGRQVITAVHEAERSVEPREGDQVLSGIRLFLDPGMRENPYVHAYSHRLVCTNGMVHETAHQPMRMTDMDVDAVLEEIERQAEKAFGEAEEMNARFAELDTHSISDFPGTVRRLASTERFGSALTERMVGRATEMVSEGMGPFTMYDAVNLLTYFATHELSDNSHRMNYQSRVGNLLASGEISCSSCGRLI